MNRLGLAHIHHVERGEPAQQEHVTPVDAREIGHQLVVAHLMIVGIDVAQLHLTVAGFGQTGLDGHHRLHLLLGCGIVVAHQLEQVFHVVLVGITNADGLRVIVQIVVAGAQSDASLPYRHEVHRGIAHVGAHANAKHHGSLALTVELCRNELILTAVLDSGYLVESRFDGGPSLAVEAHTVHHQFVERANLLAESALGGLFLSSLQNEFLNLFLTSFAEVGKRAVAGVLGIEGMRLEPASGGITIEVVAWFHGRIEIVLVDAGQSLCHSSSCHQRKGE